MIKIIEYLQTLYAKDYHGQNKLHLIVYFMPMIQLNN